MLDSTALAGLAVLALLVVLCVVLAVALVRSRSGARRELEAARAETAELRRQIEQIERVLTGPPRPARPRVEPEYTITGLGAAAPAHDPSAAPAEIDRALFADLVLRESVVKAASLAHGVRRALSAESRNRIRFEVRREIRRARKQRKSDLRDARRDWEARQRATIDDDESAA